MEWVTNYKQHSYSYKYNNGEFIILVVNSDVRFMLKYVKNRITTHITQSNNIEILKDLVFAITNHVPFSRIKQSFHMLHIQYLDFVVCDES